MELNDLKNKPRLFYHTFNPFINNKATDTDSNRSICIKDENGKIESDPINVANMLADYFSTMADGIGGPSVKDKTEQDFLEHSSLRNIDRLSKDMSNKFQLRALQPKEVEKSIAQLNVRKASGCDKITPRMFSLAAKGVAGSLCSIFNVSIQQGEWPESWKKGEWCPVFKKDDRLDKTKYRPVTLLNTVDKIYEQLLSKQIREHFEPILRTS